MGYVFNGTIYGGISISWCMCYKGTTLEIPMNSIAIWWDCDTKILGRRYLQTVLLSGGVCIYGCAGL